MFNWDTSNKSLKLYKYVKTCQLSTETNLAIFRCSAPAANEPTCTDLQHNKGNKCCSHKHKRLTVIHWVNRCTWYKRSKNLRKNVARKLVERQFAKQTECRWYCRIDVCPCAKIQCSLKIFSSFWIHLTPESPEFRCMPTRKRKCHRSTSPETFRTVLFAVNYVTIRETNHLSEAFYYFFWFITFTTCLWKINYCPGCRNYSFLLCHVMHWVILFLNKALSAAALQHLPDVQNIEYHAVSKSSVIILLIPILYLPFSLVNTLL